MHFVMKISKQCNLRCTYCYEFDELGDRERMPLEDLEGFFAGLADWYATAGVRYPLEFVLHGGEPMLLPDDYLTGFVDAQQRQLGAAGIPYGNTLQTNLTRVNRDRVELLDALDIGLGISLDVFGGERVFASGRDSNDQVLANLQHLIDWNAVDRLGVGGISVMHAGNIDDAVRTFHFWRLLGMDFRMLPIFSLADPPPRMRHLVLSHSEVLAAFKRMADAMFELETDIRVYPLTHFFNAALVKLAGLEEVPYDPAQAEWALIVNTNGDAYTHGDSYSAEGLLGNVFSDSMAEIMDGPRRQRAVNTRARRAETCERCSYGRACSRLPVVEALPSERTMDENGAPGCSIARPMIDYIAERIMASPGARSEVQASQPSAATVAL